VFIGDVQRVQLPARSTRIWVTIAAAAILLLLVGLQVTAGLAGFQGPLHSLVSDYVATPKSATVSWAALGVALVGLSNRRRILAVSVAVALDIAFAAERVLRGGVLTLGNGPTIVLTGLAVMAWRLWKGTERATALRAISYGYLLIIATKAGDTWLRITAAVRPMVLDEYALMADHALAQPSWLMGRLVEAGGPVVSDLSTAQCSHRRLAQSLPDPNVPGPWLDGAGHLRPVPGRRPGLRLWQCGARIRGR
jgi:hypothetical protein